MAKQPLMRMRPWLCVLYVSTYTTLNMSTPKYNPFFSPTSIEDQTQQENQNLDIEWSFFHQTGVLTSFYILSVQDRIREDRDSSSYINTLPSIQPSNSFYFWNCFFLANELQGLYFDFTPLFLAFSLSNSYLYSFCFILLYYCCFLPANHCIVNNENKDCVDFNL